MQFTTQGSVLLLLVDFYKMSNVLYVSINERLISVQKKFRHSKSASPVEVLKSFSYQISPRATGWVGLI